MSGNYRWVSITEQETGCPTWVSAAVEEAEVVVVVVVVVVEVGVDF
ncbi:MAG: hypothetical protein HY791_03005 [Deltaproteobacteria bacterium]|nr:hypothetical protein [Deltaproteobacteria bacterium]